MIWFMGLIAYILLCSLVKYLSNMIAIQENIVMSQYEFTIKNESVLLLLHLLHYNTSSYLLFSRFLCVWDEIANQKMSLFIIYFVWDEYFNNYTQFISVFTRDEVAFGFTSFIAI